MKRERIWTLTSRPPGTRPFGSRALRARFLRVTLGGYQIRVHQLQEQEKKFRDAVETMPALAFVADPEGNRTFLNRGWLEYTGLSSEQASGSGGRRRFTPTISSASPSDGASRGDWRTAGI